jgi:hypothetical protein
MSILASKSGLIQTVKPSQRIESEQTTALGTSSVIENLQLAHKDPNSPNAIPDIPTTEAPYDGFVAFGLFVVDESLDGSTT